MDMRVCNSTNKVEVAGMTLLTSSHASSGVVDTLDTGTASDADQIWRFT